MQGVKATVLWIGVGAVTIGGALDGCGGALGGDPGTGGRGGVVSDTGSSGSTGTGGFAGTAVNGFGQPACLPTVTKGGPCTAADQSFCYRTCGPESTGVKSETCQGGV